MTYNISIQSPSMIYGTAWKRDTTAMLVYEAIEAGFRAIDVAAQPKHYREDLVGDGIRLALTKGIVKREDLYIQTKFTWIADGEIEETPYDQSLPISRQVEQSVQNSLLLLRQDCLDLTADTSYLDCVLLHSPLPTWDQNFEAWRALEAFVPHKVRQLGISNTSLQVLHLLSSSHTITVKPRIVQNRIFSKNSFDKELRKYCQANSIAYQAFWVLTANPDLLRSEPVTTLAAEAKIDVQAALYNLVSALGNVSVLNGTTKKERMVHDLASMEHISCCIRQEKYSKIWLTCLNAFKITIGDYP